VICRPCVIESGARSKWRALAERAQIPVALTLLPGRLPCLAPAESGHRWALHGEAWVIRYPGGHLLIACGMRFDDRVPAQSRLDATKLKDSHRVDPAEVNKNIKVDVALIATWRTVLEELLAAHQ